MTGRPALLSPPPASESGPPGAAWVPRRPLRPRSGEKDAARTQGSGTARWAAATEGGMGSHPEGRVGSCTGCAAGGQHRGMGKPLQMRELEQVWDWAGLEQDVGPESMGTEAPPTPLSPAGGEAGDGCTCLGGTGTVGHTVEGGLHLWTPGGGWGERGGAVVGVPALSAVPRPSPPPLATIPFIVSSSGHLPLSEDLLPPWPLVPPGWVQAQAPLT